MRTFALVAEFGRGPLGGGHPWLGFFFGFLIPAAIVGLLVYAAITFFGDRHHPAPTPAPGPWPTPPPAAPGYGTPPESVLEMRLARGEIDPDQYFAALDALRRGRAGWTPSAAEPPTQPVAAAPEPDPTPPVTA